METMMKKSKLNKNKINKMKMLKCLKPLKKVNVKVKKMDQRSKRLVLIMSRSQLSLTNTFLKNLNRLLDKTNLIWMTLKMKTWMNPWTQNLKSS